MRKFDYYRKFWKAFAQRSQGHLYFLMKGDQLAAGAFIITYGKVATYKDGASTPHITPNGSYLLQWHIIQDLTSSTETSIYDLCGTPPSHQLSDKTHMLHGVGVFKRYFKKEVTDYVGCWDFALKTLTYRLWKVGLSRAINWWYARRPGKFFY